MINLSTCTAEATHLYFAFGRFYSVNKNAVVRMAGRVLFHIILYIKLNQYIYLSNFIRHVMAI